MKSLVALLLGVTLFVSAFAVAGKLYADPVPEALPQCTHQQDACQISYSLFGTCCLSLQGLGRTRTAGATESRTARTTTDPCGAQHTFFIFPCARFNGMYCGGTEPNMDCNYVNPP